MPPQAVRILMAGCGSHDELVRIDLEQDTRLALCSPMGNAAETVAMAIEVQPHVAVIAVEHPGGGVDAAREIVARLPQTSIVMIADDDTHLFPALGAGAGGYLLRNGDTKGLADIICQAAAGTVVAMPTVLLRQVIRRFRDPNALRRNVADAEAAPLTSREWQILALLRDGLTTADISEQLSISVATVRSHRRHIRRKLADDASY